VSLLTPVLILGMPIFDTLFVMYIRFLRGLPVFLGSPDHMAIRLRHWGLSVTQVVVISYLGAALLGGIGLLVMAVPQNLAVILSGVTMAWLAAAAVALTRLKVSTGVPRLNSEAASRPIERTGAL
jgi:UDP-GlcNAc:undecaprenyl-phosphate GlcNAc-1-phosphate transferase